MFEQRVNELKKIKWTVLPRVLYDAIVLPLLSYADLVVFSHSDPDGEDFCKTLAEAHLTKFSVLTPPTYDDSRTLLWKDALIDDTRKTFLAALITTPNFNPKEINLDDYKLIGLKINKEPARVFSPLHYLYETGNQALLNKIYDEAKTENNGESLFYKDISVICLLRHYLETEELDAIKPFFTKIQLAIATYQPITEIERLYEELEKIAGTHFTIIFDRLFNYAWLTTNKAAFDYFDTRAPMHQDLFTTCERKSFDLDLLVEQFAIGVNPLHLLDPYYAEKAKQCVTETNIKNLTTAMFWFCKKKEKAEKKEQTHEAIVHFQNTFTWAVK